jgi:sugar lactone lactonase YvrE
MAVVVLDQRLLDLIDPDVKVEKIATGYVFTEGPIWHPKEHHLTYSDVYGDAMYRWTPSGGAQVFRSPSEHANGNTYDHQGRLITCLHDRRLIRTNPDGSTEDLATHFDSARLNSPNDVICLPNGDLIFTDPNYGLRQPDGSIAGQEYPACGLTPDGTLTLLLDSIPSPNGLALTDDGRTLYVCNTAAQTVHAFDVTSEGAVGNGRVVCELKRGDAQGRPDGMKLDSRGNLWVAGNGPEGIWVFEPGGSLLGFVGTGDEINRQRTAPGGPSNMAWGDDDWQTIYATAVTSVYRLRAKIPGQPVRIH